MTREQFYREACLQAMAGLLACSGLYKDELLNDPVDHTTDAVIEYARALTEKVYGPKSKKWQDIQDSDGWGVGV